MVTRKESVSTNLTTPGIGSENSQNHYKPRVQEWIYLLIGCRGDVGVIDQSRVYVTTCSETFPLNPKAVPDSEQAYRKRGDIIVKNFVIVAPDHPR